MAKWVLEPGMMLAPLALNTRWQAKGYEHTPVLRLEGVEGTTAPTLWCLRDYWTGRGVEWVISEMSMPGLKIDGGTFKATNTSYCGAPWFEKQGIGDVTGVFFFSEARLKWIYRPEKSSPEEPFAAIGLDGETWEGDSWYECGQEDFHFANDRTELAPAGTLRNDDDADSVEATPWWPRWIRMGYQSTSPEPAGVYLASASAGLTPLQRVVGLPVWKDQFDAYYPRSLEKSRGHFTFGAASWDSGREAYVIGDTSSDWFESANPPTIVGSVTFKNKVYDPNTHEVVNGGRPDLALSLHHYELGDNTEVRYLAEVVPWRW